MAGPLVYRRGKLEGAAHPWAVARSEEQEAGAGGARWAGREATRAEADGGLRGPGGPRGQCARAHGPEQETE